MDFIQERTEDGRSFRVSVIDQFQRECIALEADRSMTGHKVVAALERVIEHGRPAPESITTDDGSEFAGKAVDGRLTMHLSIGLQRPLPRCITSGDRRFALFTLRTASGHPSQGFASPAGDGLPTSGA